MEITDEIIITEETKVMDLIPEGYEIDVLRTITPDFENTGLIAFSIKTKEVKDFSWYVKKYLSETKIVLWKDSDNSDSFFDKNYDSIPFEIKIGLLKFICDDLGIMWTRTIDGDNNDTDPIIKICPEGFLKSIFK